MTIDTQDEEAPRAGQKRRFKGKTARVLWWLSALFGLYLFIFIIQLPQYVDIFIPQTQHNALVLATVLALVFIWYPATSRSPNNRVPWYDWLAVLAAIAVNAYIFFMTAAIIKRPYQPATGIEQLFALIMVALVLEGVRRAVGLSLAVIGAIFFFYPFFAGYMPGFLESKSQNLPRVAEMTYVFPHGIYGDLLSIFGTLVAAFLLFGAFIQSTGAGKFMVNTAYSLMGRFRGGPAKVSVLASCLFGMINGSALANVSLIGPVTIPLMKQVGYKPHFAGAVEAVASNGGQIMPPVLGLVAFIMMNFLGLSYLDVVKAATIPALLYFAGLFVMLDIEAVKTGIKGLPRSQVPTMKNTFQDGWLYIVPIILLVVLIMVVQFSPQTSCMYSLIVVVAVTWLKKKDERMGGRKIMNALSTGVDLLPSLGVTICMASILVGSMEVTGLGVRVAGGLARLSGGNLPLLLTVTGLAAVVLGMGIPTSAVYILCAILLAPALVTLGLKPITAHFIVWYFGMTAMLSPPVCLVSFVAAGIAGAPMMKTGWAAMRLGIVIYLLPFVIAYRPQLLLQGDWQDIVLVAALAFISIWLLSIAVEGYLLTKAGWPVRIALAVGALFILVPNLVFPLVGGALAVLSMLWQARAARLMPASPQRSV